MNYVGNLTEKQDPVPKNPTQKSDTKIHHVGGKTSDKKSENPPQKKSDKKSDKNIAKSENLPQKKSNKNPMAVPKP